MQSLLDQVNILIKMKVGDPYRLEHIKLMLKQKRTVYGSDRAYLDKLIHEYIEQVKTQKKLAKIPSQLAETDRNGKIGVLFSKILNSISKNIDICEIGFPHNTPIADGGQIQTSAYRAIKNGIKISDVFQIAKNFKKTKK